MSNFCSYTCTLLVQYMYYKIHTCIIMQIYYFSAAVPGATPSFVHSDYFCDSRHQYSRLTPLDYFVHEPLWDGAGCIQGTCCEFNSPPWFCKDLPQSTSDDIELRICGNEGIDNEDTPIERVEIYVQ